MIRFIVIFILVSLSIYAKDIETCYTVQLFSDVNSKEKYEILSKNHYHNSCKLLKVADNLTVRCGCYKGYSKAKNKLIGFKKKYKHAYIATMYKSLFNENKSQVKIIKKENNLKNEFLNYDEELKLMLQAFLYSNDLVAAYETAKMGYLKNPNSYYWNQKMAEISKWTGRGEKAIKYMKFLYEKTNDKKIEKDLIDYALSNYQYENIKKIILAKTQKNPTKENIKRMLYVYSQIGIPEESAEILENIYQKDKNQKILLTKILQIYLDIGDLESAKKTVDTIEKEKIYTIKNIELLSYFYYLKNDMNASYEVLKMTNNREYNTKYYQLLSDLGWYLQKYEASAEASLKIIQNNEGRLVDYERVINANITKDEKLSLKMSLEAYKKFKQSFLFYAYANSALKQKRFNELKGILEDIDKSDSSIKNNPNFWIIKSEVYNYFKMQDLTLSSLEMAMKLSDNNIQTQLTALYLYLNYNLYNKSKYIVDKIAENKNLISSYYYPLASTYFTLHDINRASYYVDKLVRSDDEITNSIDFKFLQAYIFQIRNNENAFITKMREIISILKKDALNDPTVLTRDKYLNNLLRAEFHTLHADLFEKKLIASKKYLTKKHYDDISYSFAMKNNASDQAYDIYKRVSNKELWLRFTNAMQRQNHSKIENLLKKYLDSLPIGDASQASQKDGQISLSQSIAFEALYKNDDNQNAYIQHMNLSQKRSDEFDFKTAYYSRDPILTKYIQLKNKTYINDGLYLLTGVNYYINSILDEDLIRDIPRNTLEFNIGIRNIFDRGKVEFIVGKNGSMQDYAFFSLLGTYKLNHYFTIGGSIEKNINANEGTQLILGGKKDMISFDFKWDILYSTSLEFKYERDEYTSQDDVDLGSGDYQRIIFGHQIRNGYPDMRISTFIDHGKYSETSGSRGVIDELQFGVYPVLPEEFYNIGVNFAYGMENSRLYTRVWRPYFEMGTYYNSVQRGLSFSVNGGYGGKLWNQDHLVVGGSFSNSLNGTGGNIFEIFLRYQFIYLHR